MQVEPDVGDPDWAREGVFEVAPGVFRIPLPLPTDGLRAVNVYALVDEHGVVLVDSGWAIEAAREALVRALDVLGHGLADIRRFLVTHVHRDHYELAVNVRREFGNTVSLGLGEKTTIDLLTAPDLEPLASHGRQLVRAGAFELVRVAASGGPPTSATIRPTGRARTTGWSTAADLDLSTRVLRVVATPGSHPWPRGVRGCRRRPAVRRRPRVAAHHPVDRVRGGTRPAAVGRLHGLATAGPPAAGPPVVAGPRPGQPERAHPGRRTARSSRSSVGTGLRGGGGRTGPPRTRRRSRLTWTRRARAFADLDPFNQMLAILETGAHLDVLVAQGRLTGRTDNQGVCRYSEV